MRVEYGHVVDFVADLLAGLSLQVNRVALAGKGFVITASAASAIGENILPRCRRCRTAT